MNTSPLLMLDVDGPLYPNRAYKKPPGYGNYRVTKIEMGVPAKPARIWLNKKHGAWLKALDCDMIWATSWEDSANSQIGRPLGLPKLPHITFSNRTYMPNHDMSHWKLDDILIAADGRPFVWIDDGITGADTVRAAIEYPAPALLYRVDPRWGLSRDDMVNIWYWLKHVS